MQSKVNSENANKIFEELAIKDTIDRNQAIRQRNADALGNLSVINYGSRDDDSGFRTITLANGTPQFTRYITNSDPSQGFVYSYLQGTTASAIGSIDTKPA
jgi:hypothetical protein